MRKLIYILILCIPTLAMAQSVSYTALGAGPQYVWAGVKSQEPGNEPETHLVQINQDVVLKKINLPSDLVHREIIALLPSNNEVVVVTQRRIEQGDRPLFHSYQPKSGKWLKLGESDCVSFAELKTSKSEITLRCVEMKSDKEVTTDKKLVLQGVDLGVNSITLPQTKISKSSVSAELLGQPFEWNELKVEMGKKQKKFTP